MDLQKVTCETPEQFRAEVEKWQKKGAAPIIRGRKLIAYGEIVAELVTSQHGGARQGAGRKPNDRIISISVKVSQEAFDKLNAHTNNKSEFIDNMLKAL